MKKAPKKMAMGGMLGNAVKAAGKTVTSAVKSASTAMKAPPSSPSSPPPKNPKMMENVQKASKAITGAVSKMRFSKGGMSKKK